jgi:hypothetical protein
MSPSVLADHDRPRSKISVARIALFPCSIDYSTRARRRFERFEEVREPVHEPKTGVKSAKKRGEAEARLEVRGFVEGNKHQQFCRVWRSDR